jgi:hypothetical protein
MQRDSEKTANGNDLARPVDDDPWGAILVWLSTWGILDRLWSNKTVAAGLINAIALGLMALSLILTFPSVGDLF